MIMFSAYSKLEGFVILFIFKNPDRNRGMEKQTALCWAARITSLTVGAVFAALAFIGIYSEIRSINPPDFSNISSIL